MPNSQLRHSVVLYVAPLVKNCAKLCTQEHWYLPSLGLLALGGLRMVPCASRIWHGIFHMVPLACMLLALPKTLSGPLEGSFEAGSHTVFYWTLFMLFHSFLSTTLTWCFASPMRLSPFAVCSTWVYLICCDWWCWCDCKNCPVPHLPRKYKFGQRRVAANLKTCLMRGAQRAQAHPANCGFQ